MKLLIVEDEKMTREGLLQSLDWQKIGVTRVLSAENGEAGLFLARRILPDIVLTDIRMPRMDGITMAGRIRELLPDCRIIFLSAYSEIDYYKAAIDLKAVRYLDKPIESARLQEAVAEAVAECSQVNRYKTSSDLHHMQERQKLADAICAGEGAEALEKASRQLDVPFGGKTCELLVTAFIIRLRRDRDGDMPDDYNGLAARLCESMGYVVLSTTRHDNRIVLFLLTQKPGDCRPEAVCKKLRAILGNQRDYYIMVGKTVHGLKNGHKSYSAAKDAMHISYCFPWGQIVPFCDDARWTNADAYAPERERILSALSEKQEQEALSAAGELRRRIEHNRDLRYYQARELYFEIISEIYRTADSLHLQIKENEAGEMISWVVRIEDFNLDELHGFLCRLIILLFQAIEESKSEKTQILAVKDYIAKHYTEDTLSISDISAFLHMSVSHVCTIFKKETGDTINQYLTDYRLRKAKRYLSETLLSVSEISWKVGYKDNSYFGRIFRKHFGMTPNEYRRR